MRNFSKLVLALVVFISLMGFEKNSKIEKPSIGILNVGSEDLKGSDAVRSASLLLRESDLKECFYLIFRSNR